MVEGIRDGCKMGAFVMLLFEHLLEKLCAGMKGCKGLKWFAYPVYSYFTDYLRLTPPLSTGLIEVFT